MMLFCPVLPLREARISGYFRAQLTSALDSGVVAEKGASLAAYAIQQSTERG
jgi:hypothetical protein